MARLTAGLFCLVLTRIAAAAPAALPLDDVQLISDAGVTGYQVPAPQTFSIDAAGSYTVTLIDLGTANSSLPPLKSLQMAIVSSTATSAVLTAAGTQTVTLQPGTYTVQVLARPDTGSGSLGGQFSWQVAPNGSGSQCSGQCAFVGGVGLPNNPSSGVSSYHQQFTLSPSQAGSYQLTLTDRSFPTALQSLEAIVVPQAGANGGQGITQPTPGSSPGTTLGAGTYDLYVLAAASTGAGNAGLYSVSVQGPAVPVATTQPVGSMPPALTFNVPGAEPVGLQLADLSNSAVAGATLAALSAVVTQGPNQLGQVSAGNASFNTSGAGSIQLFVWARPPAGGQGIYAAYATDASGTLLDSAQPVLGTGAYGYAYPTPVLAAGAYQLGLYDFKVPSALGSLSVVAIQHAASLGSVNLATAGGSVSLTAQAGGATLVALPTLANAGDQSLFGLTLTQGSAGGSDVLDDTQGVGAGFTSLPVNVSTAGTYAIKATDLQFPARLGLSVFVTRGEAVVGNIFGAGHFTFAAATPGLYTINVLATVGTISGTDAGYGLYGLHVAAAAPPPTVSVIAAAPSIGVGQSTTLTWSATNAVSCTASGGPTGSGWSGTLAASGSMATGALAVTTTFTLSCANADGVATSASALVSVSSASSGSGGGGAWSPGALLPLGLFAAGTSWRRRRPPRVKRSPQPPGPKPTDALRGACQAAASVKAGPCR